jgi:uncharacterized protein involved in exopolysaccharide biosynthesis
MKEMKTQAPTFSFDSFNLLNFLIKQRKVILLTILVTAFISAVATFLITPDFKSVTVIFPSPNVLETRSLLNTQNSATDFFGDESATEMVLQIIQSDKISDYLLKKYDLLNHYEISGKEKQYTFLEKKMKKNISARKTEFNSIEITVLDTDPVLAASMANDIAAQVDSVFNSLRKDAAVKSLKVITELYNTQLLRVNAIEDSLAIPAGNGGRQSGSGNEVISESVLSFIGQGRRQGDTSTGILKGTTYSPDYVRLLNAFFLETENLSVIQEKLLEAKTYADQDLQYVYIIKRAKVAEVKATPNRTLIVAISVFSTTILMLIILLLPELTVKDEKQGIQ